MDKIIEITKLADILPSLHSSSDELVLAGGCFDRLHEGHTHFLQKAKKQGEILIVLLESDEMIQKRKGQTRPFETQQQRAARLSQLDYVDHIILLPSFMDHHDYDELVSQLKPAIIATTKGDPQRHHKERQAKAIKAQVIDVIPRLSEYSTTLLSK